MAQPMSYFLFKLNLEMAHVSTFGRDDWVQKKYQEYLSNFKSQKNFEKEQDHKLLQRQP